MLTAILTGVLLISATASSEHNPATDKPVIWSGDVQVYGALRAMFHEGQTGTTVSLDTMLPNPNLYAVGALSDLAGEITVAGGQVYVSRPKGIKHTDTEILTQTYAGATLLVAAEVPAWNSFTIEQSIQFEDLDEEIARLALAAGHGLDRRIPFLVEGVVEDLEWHVVDGSRLSGGGTTHQDHLAAAVTSRLDHITATLIGFYSQTDQGVFTHMGSTTHIHCLTTSPLATGHVDSVRIPAGTRIKFPVVTE